jgi:hypothetical protein
MTIIDKRRGGGAAADLAQQTTQRAIDTNVPAHVKTGVKLSGVVVPPGGVAASVAHGLQRVPVGWHTMRVTGTGVGQELVEKAGDANTISFARPAASTGAFTYDIWVF